MNYVIAAAIIIVMGMVVGAWVGMRLRQPETLKEVAQLREAIADLEREVGKAFLPVLERVALQLSRWVDRKNRGPE